MFKKIKKGEIKMRCKNCHQFTLELEYGKTCPECGSVYKDKYREEEKEHKVIDSWWNVIAATFIIFIFQLISRGVLISITTWDDLSFFSFLALAIIFFGYLLVGFTNISYGDLAMAITFAISLTNLFNDLNFGDMFVAFIANLIIGSIAVYLVKKIFFL